MKERKLRERVFLTAGYHTVSLGPGRKEFHPARPRPGIEHYIVEAGRGSLAQTSGALAIDEAVVSNFMAERFVRQAHLGAFVPRIDPALAGKPAVRVEGACASGGLGLVTSLKSVLSGLAETSLTVGVEVMNSVKPVYGADMLAGACHYEAMRKDGHAYFFPDIFSQKAGAYFQRYGRERTRLAMAAWYENAIFNARTCPQAQEHDNADPDPRCTATAAPDPERFLEHLNQYDCSKISDGASAIIACSEEGLERLGRTKAEAVEVVGVGQAAADIGRPAPDQTRLDTSQRAVRMALEMAAMTAADVGVFECHDCFSITGLLCLEAAGFAGPGEAPGMILDGHVRRAGRLPVNTTGGLIGFGHYVGGTGVRQAVDLLRQLTGSAGESQVDIDEARPIGLLLNMGGDDKTAVALVVRRAG